ncbi:hypothetical protein EDD29_8548 [Actinocorallia herbida]|uniref:Uncharacterized protein n=1 Tax=Actinocorallia herbida TaxID=58109 RepID=A0A3N1DBD1_9ACTN|nr:hypothetical protein [Actinocorallia herbida]ROO90809.1 hypothetical protein EDD29_8548 [Actinocorallia herbida]
MRLTLLQRRIVASAAALGACLTLTAFSLRTERVGLEFATGTAWLRSRAIGKIMLADGMSGEVSGSVPLDGLLSPEMFQAADPLLVWQDTTPELRRVDARRMTGETAATLPAPPARLVGTTDGAYAFREGGSPSFVPREEPTEAREVDGFTGPADDAVVDDWGVLWALSLDEGRAVPFHAGTAEEPVRVGAVRGTVDLIVHDGEAALFVPASGEIRGLRDGTVTRLPATGAGLLPVENTSGTRVPVLQPPRTLLVPGKAGPGVRRVELGGAGTVAARAFQLGSAVYVPDLPAGRLLVYDLVTGAEEDPIQIDDRTIASAGFEMFGKDGMLWVNEIDGPNALVIRENGHRLIRKYDEKAEKPPFPGTASLEANAPTSRPSAPPAQLDPSAAPSTGPPSPNSSPTPPQTSEPGPSGPVEEAPTEEPEPVPTGVADGPPTSLDGPEGSAGLLYSPDGRALAVSGGHEVMVYEMPAKRLRGRLRGVGGAMAFSQDSRTFAAVSADDGKSVLLYDVQTLERTGHPPLEGAWMFAEVPYPITFDLLSFADEGRTLIGGGGPYANSRDAQRVISWDLAEPGEYTRLGMLGLLAVKEPSPDGTRLLWTGYGEARVLWISGDIGGLPEEKFEDAHRATWTGDGEAVVTLGEKITVRSLATGAMIRSIDYTPQEINHGDGGIYTAIAANRDGSVVALSGKDGTLTFWDTVTGQRRGDPLDDLDAGSSLRFSPDDETVAVSGGDGNVWIVEVPGR